MAKIFGIFLIFILASCSYSPILDENDKYLSTSKEKIDKDIANCEAKAENYLKGRKMKKVGKAAIRKGAIGSIFGFGIGLFTGGGAERLIAAMFNNRHSFVAQRRS